MDKSISAYKNRQDLVKAMACSIIAEAINEATETRDIIAKFESGEVPNKTSKRVLTSGISKAGSLNSARSQYERIISWFRVGEPDTPFSFHYCCRCLEWNPGLVSLWIKRRISQTKWTLGMSGDDFGPDRWLARAAISDVDEFVNIEIQDFTHLSKSNGMSPRKFGYYQETASIGFSARLAILVRDVLLAKDNTGPTVELRDMSISKQVALTIKYQALVSPGAFFY